MTVPVELPDLADVMARYRFAYLLTAHADPVGAASSGAPAESC